MDLRILMIPLSFMFFVICGFGITKLIADPSSVFQWAIVLFDFSAGLSILIAFLVK